MKAEKLLEIIGNAEDTLVLETQKPSRYYRRIKRAMACAAVLLLIIAGQSIELSNMRCYLIDTGNGGNPGELSISRAEGTVLWAKGMFQSETAPEERTVTFDGKTYTGKYVYSVCGVGRSDVTDYYRTEEKNSPWDEFGVAAETGELSSINLAGYDFFGRQSGKQPMKQPEILALAEKWAGCYIDTDRYVMRQTNVSRDTENDLLLYSFAFVRVVGGRDTTDQLYIQLTDRGELCQISGMQTGWVKGKSLALARLRLVDVEKKLRHALGEKPFQIQSCKYGITPEGKPVILVTCTVSAAFGNTQILLMIQ